MTTTTEVGPRTRRLLLVSALVVVAAVGVGAYLVGRSHSSATIRHGQATSVLGAINAQVAGSGNYYIPMDVVWIDSGGSYRSEGRPECLPPVGTGNLPVTFATVKVKDPSGVERDQVIWVDCTGWNPPEDLTPGQAANIEIDTATK